MSGLLACRSLDQYPGPILACQILVSHGSDIRGYCQTKAREHISISDIGQRNYPILETILLEHAVLNLNHQYDYHYYSPR